MKTAMLMKKIRSPILLQWNKKKVNYFEGWYYKQVSQDEKTAFSLIPGVSAVNEDFHSFVQYIFVDEKAGRKNMKTGYIRYSPDEFIADENPFGIRIGDNVFSETGISVDLADPEVNLKGTIELGSFRTIRKSILMPGIMGFFAYFPWMECNHGIVSMNHKLRGTLTINGNTIDFSGGKGYIEKDWGTSFPEKYIWIQCNSFKNEDTSLSCSIADIPVLGKNFFGFICCLISGGIEYRFATYNNSTFDIECLSDTKISLVFRNKDAELRVEAKPAGAGALLAPQNGKMQQVIKEGLTGEVEIQLLNKREGTACKDVGSMAGIEIRDMQI